MTYEYIEFIKVSETEKTTIWSCVNKKSQMELGRVKWFGPWRQYCFLPSGPSVYSTGCLKDIAGFMALQMEQRKHKGEENEVC